MDIIIEEDKTRATRRPDNPRYRDKTMDSKNNNTEMQGEIALPLGNNHDDNDDGDARLLLEKKKKIQNKERFQKEEKEKVYQERIGSSTTT